jgi:hypothetical protein
MPRCFEVGPAVDSFWYFRWNCVQEAASVGAAEIEQILQNEVLLTGLEPVLLRLKKTEMAQKGRQQGDRREWPGLQSVPKVVPAWSSPEQVGVSARSDELKNVAFDSVDEQPIGLDVTLPAVSEHALEWVVSVLWR